MEDIYFHIRWLIIGFIILIVISSLISWEIAVIVMFFWLCIKTNIICSNQEIITDNQRELETLLEGLK